MVISINNSLYMAWKYACLFVGGRYLFREANSLEPSSMKTVSFDKYPSISSRQMEVIKFIVFVTRAVLKIGEYHVQVYRCFVTVYNFEPKLRSTALFLYILLTVFVFVGICLVRKICRHVLGFKQHLISYSIVA